MTDVGDENECANLLGGGKKKKKTLTAVGLLLIGLVLAVGHAVTGQGVLDAVAISTLKLIHDVARGVERCARKAKERV